MKKFKISFVALVAIMLGFAASSFTVHPPKKTGAMWFTFSGTDPRSAGDYQIYTGGGDPGCEADPDPDQVCAILVDEDGDNPGQPDPGELNTIYTNSSHFTQPELNLKYKDPDQ